jgi:hypothetical protein
MSESKYIDFEFYAESDSKKTKIFGVVTKIGAKQLGKISWYGPWRRYCFYPIFGDITIFEETCLRDIANFIEEQTKEHKEKLNG